MGVCSSKDEKEVGKTSPVIVGSVKDEAAEPRVVEAAVDVPKLAVIQDAAPAAPTPASSSSPAAPVRRPSLRNFPRQESLRSPSMRRLSLKDLPSKHNLFEPDASDEVRRQSMPFIPSLGEDFPRGLSSSVSSCVPAL